MVPMSNREVTGSLFERNGRYTAVLNLYDKNGKRRQKSVALGIPVKGNKRKAQARLEELKKEYSAGIMEPEPPQEESPLFADFLREWLKITAPTIERTTYQSYKGLIDARLDAFFRERGLRLEELEPKHIRELHQSIFKDGCNANTVIHYRAGCGQLCKGFDAVLPGKCCGSGHGASGRAFEAAGDGLSLCDCVYAL